MNPEIKAKELVERMMLYSYEKKEDDYSGFHFQKKSYTQYKVDYKIKKENAIECALIAVYEAKKCTKYEKQMFENDRFSEDYWNLVEQEINKLWNN